MIGSGLASAFVSGSGLVLGFRGPIYLKGTCLNPFEHLVRVRLRLRVSVRVRVRFRGQGLVLASGLGKGFT